MPIYDLRCNKCSSKEEDVLLKVDEEYKCKNCGDIMERLPSTFGFNFTPSGISKYKKKYGKTVPEGYKTQGGANIYGVPRKP